MRAIVSSAFLFIALWAMGGCMRSGHKNQPLFLYKELQDSVEAFVRDSMPKKISWLLSHRQRIIWCVNLGEIPLLAQVCLAGRSVKLYAQV